jgi:hypothetical protein
MLAQMVFRMVIAMAVCAVSSIGQATKKEPPVQGKADMWQRSKECAMQSEKLMADDDRRAVASGVGIATHWENHYSPKYNRCFVSASYMTSAKDGGGKTVPMFQTQLSDAFERSVLANSAAVGPTNGFCHIEDRQADCDKVAIFISEHMKN